MITFQNQIVYIVYFLLLGMFLGINNDFLQHCLKQWRVKTIPGYIIQSIYWLGLVYVSCLYIFKISEGLISIYTFVFFFIGVLIYNIFLQKAFLINLNFINKHTSKTYKQIKPWIIFALYPKEVIIFIKKAITIRKTKIKKTDT